MCHGAGETAQVPVGEPHVVPRAASHLNDTGTPWSPPALRVRVTELPSQKKKAGRLPFPRLYHPTHRLAFNTAFELHHLHDSGLVPRARWTLPWTLGITISQVGWERWHFPTEVVSAHLPTPLTLTSSRNENLGISTSLIWDPRDSTTEQRDALKILYRKRW